jgi:tetratricopeptide (TPR) repeat protein
VLVDANLLDDARGGLYVFHDLIRLHAREMAEQEDPHQVRDRTVRRMLDWYLAAVTTAGQLVTPYRRDQPRDIEYPPDEPVRFADAAEALDWLEGELPNLHAVVSYARDHGLPRVAWQLVDAMWPLFLRRGLYHERLAFDRMGLAAAEISGDAEGRGKMLDRLGLALISARDVDEATDCFRQASVIWRSAGNERRLAGSLQRIGLAEHARGHPDEALTMFGEALGAYQQLGEQRAVALTLADMGAAMTDAGRPAEAIEHLEQAGRLLEGIPDAYNRARTLARLGRAQERAGEHSTATVTLGQALDAMHVAQSPRGEAEILWLLGELAEADGRPVRAQRAYEEALEILERIGAPGAAALRDRLERLAGAE